jgi:G2/mitotic-specific cyclin 1/2
MATLLSEDDASEMDLDVLSHGPAHAHGKREVASAMQMQVGAEDGSSVGEVSDEEEEEEEEEEEDDDDWLRMSEEDMIRNDIELADVKSRFEDEVDMFDTTMVAEYAEDIFKHMEELELSVMPNPRYMDFQTEIEW